MAFSTVVLATLLAVGPNWAIVDLPYPETGGEPSAAAPSPAVRAQILEAVNAHRRSREVRRLVDRRKPCNCEVTLEGRRATVKVLDGSASETLRLEHADGAWRVVEP